MSFINRNTRVTRPSANSFDVCVSVNIEWADTHKGKFTYV